MIILGVFLFFIFLIIIYHYFIIVLQILHPYANWERSISSTSTILKLKFIDTYLHKLPLLCKPNCVQIPKINQAIGRWSRFIVYIIFDWKFETKSAHFMMYVFNIVKKEGKCTCRYSISAASFCELHIMSRLINENSCLLDEAQTSFWEESTKWEVVNIQTWKNVQNEVSNSHAYPYEERAKLGSQLEVQRR